MKEEGSLSEKFHDYLITVHRKILNYLFGTLDDPSPENFHQLRIQLKRFRFIGRTLSNYDRKGIDKRLRPYRKIFRLAGQIRQHQVHASLLDRHGLQKLDENVSKKWPGPGRYLKKWPEATGRFLADAVQCYPVVARSILAWKITEDEYVNELSERIAMRFGSEIPEDRLHDNRKLLKEMLYSCEISPGLRKYFNARFDLRTAIRLEDAIGDWHDLDVLLQQNGHGKPISKKKTRDHLKHEMVREHKKIQKLITRLMRKVP